MEAKQFEEEAFARQQKLIEDNFGLAEAVARQIKKSLPLHIDIDDLVGDGSVGLIKAARDYDEDRGVMFSTYAIPRIRGAIIDGMRERDVLPRSLRRKLKGMNKAKDDIELRFGREATVVEITEELGITEKEFREITVIGKRSVSLSIDENQTHIDQVPWDKTGDQTFIKCFLSDNDEGNPIHGIEREATLALCSSLVQRLDRREQEIIRLYYHENKTLREVGGILGVTESRIAQIKIKSLKKLRKMVEKDG